LIPKYLQLLRSRSEKAKERVLPPIKEKLPMKKRPGIRAQGGAKERLIIFKMPDDCDDRVTRTFQYHDKLLTHCTASDWSNSPWMI
jgi:hypothetical protein